MNTFLLCFVTCMHVVISSASHAALYDRGNGLIYDDVLDITWMQDANALALFENYSSSDYKATSGDAHNLISDLIYSGYDDWRLPSVGSAPRVGYDQYTGELGHMFFHNLGNTTGLDNVSFSDATDGSTMSFLNVQQYAYMYSEYYSGNVNLSWVFNMSDGYQYFDELYYSGNGALWAVRDGDSIPIPATAWLFGSAIAGLLVANRKRG